MIRLTDIVRRMLRRAATRAPIASRTRLGILALEDRVVPVAPLVSVAAMNDAVEDGTAGAFEFVRFGSTSGSLVINYSVSGTATGTEGEDYVELTGSVTIPSGQAVATVNVDAVHDGLLDPDETVIVTITESPGNYMVDTMNSASIEIIDIDILPVAFDGWTTTSVNEPVVVEVLDLATSLYGDTLTTASVTQGEEGSVVVNQNGTVTYTPGTDFVGEDSFTYTVEDPFGNESTGTITVTVTAPIAPPTSVWTATNTAVNIEVLNMAFDPDGDTLTTTAVTQGDYGSVTIETDGSVTYTPGSNFTGDDSFTYTVEDPDGNEATHTITVTVGPTDPIALHGAAETSVNTSVNVVVLDLAYQPAGGSITTTGVTQGSHGSVVIETDGSVTYTPGSTFEGTDTFTYTVTDGSSRTGIGTITVTVGPVASPADNIIAELSEIEDAIAEYDTSDPPDLASLAAAVASAISDYLEDVTSFISANDLNQNGLRDIALSSYLGVLDKVSSLNSQQGALDALLLASKTLIEDLTHQLETAFTAQNPNQPLIISIRDQLEIALQAHDSAKTAMVRTQNAVNSALAVAYLEYLAIKRAYSDSAAVLGLYGPPTLQTYPLSRYTPKP